MNEVMTTSLAEGAGEREWTPLFTAEGRLHLTLAISEYDHVRALCEGEVRPEGIQLTTLGLSVEEIFYRFLKYREWDVSELSFAKYVSLKSQGDRSLSGIPVFPSRVFRHSSIYIRRGGPVRTPADLAGRRVGLPEWAQTAAVYSRGFLVHQYGLKLQDIEWVQAGVNQPGRVEKVALKLPPGVRYSARPDSTLEALLLAGEVDAIATAHPPDGFVAGNPAIVRLFEDYRPVEERYWRETGIFPIMHVIAIRSAVLERFPWVARNLMTAFEAAKRPSLERALEMTASRFPVPWAAVAVEEAQALFGGDPWPYGIEANRKTLDAFLAYAFEQGVCHRKLTPEDLFPRELQSAFRV